MCLILYEPRELISMIYSQDWTTTKDDELTTGEGENAQCWEWQIRSGSSASSCG